MDAFARRLALHLVRLFLYLGTSTVVALALGERLLAALIMGAGITLEAAFFWIPMLRALKRDAPPEAPPDSHNSPDTQND